MNQLLLAGTFKRSYHRVKSFGRNTDGRKYLLYW